jgi:hypothetical protein
MFDQLCMYACPEHPHDPGFTPSHHAVQARHTLEHILRTQIQQKRDALKQVQQQTQDIQQKITAAVQQLATPVGDSAESAAPG